MNERLEEIKVNAEDISYIAYGDGGRDSFKVEKVELAKHDYDWLIQQAELADLLVTDKSRVQLEKRVEELEEALLQTKYDRCLYIASVEKRERYKQALEKIATRKMSQYLTVRDMNNDFIKIANKALEELK